jgi:hypothetical protein
MQSTTVSTNTNKCMANPNKKLDLSVSKITTQNNEIDDLEQIIVKKTKSKKLISINETIKLSDNVEDIINYDDMSNSDDSTKINSLDKFINKKKTVKVITKVTQTKTTKEINHEVVTYKNKEYVVCCIPFKDEYKLFIIDADKKNDVITKNWHFMPSGMYVAQVVYDESNTKKQLYLHNFIMDKLTFDGKGQQKTIDHINRIGTDNRKENLRNADSQTAQNFNQKKRDRKTELPEDCNIQLEEIPKNVYYKKPNGLHGEFFYIELRGIPVLCPNDKKFTWKSTKSKSVGLIVKLQQTINKLVELKTTYPELQNVIFDENNDNVRKTSITDYNNILKLSHYPKNVIDTNLRDFYGDFCISDLIENNTELVDQVDAVETIKNAGKKSNNLPPDCGITIDQIPKYCYFRPESDKRGCRFIIERHPKLIAQGTRQWGTTESKKISIQDKFNSMLEKLAELNEL